MFEPSDEFKESSILQPKSWDDYVPFAGWMIYRKLLIAILILLVLLLTVVIIWLLRTKPEPKPQGIPIYYHLDELLKLYSGEVILTDESDRVIYRGQVQNGLRSGWGRDLFALDGSSKYEGEFRGDLYEGHGILFGDGEVQYEGEFANGLFHGQGVLFEKKIKKYEGSFANGLPDGEGVLYDESENIRYQGDFARGVREGKGLEIAVDGVPVYEGEFREDMYDGQGVLYTTGGSRLKFDGVFVRGKPSREGKIYNLQGQLLYEGPVLNGKVDCLGLLGLGESDWKTLVKEKPVVYFGGGFVGYLYGELGLSAIGVYEVEQPKAAEEESSVIENPVWADGYPPLTDAQTDTEHQQDSPPFSSDDIIFCTMLIEGRQYAEQAPLSTGAKVKLDEIIGFEAFMSSRLAAVEDPTIKIKTEAEIKRIDNNTYEVTNLPDMVKFDGDCVYRDLIYYYFGGTDLSKGGVPNVIHCRKRQFGG